MLSNHILHHAYHALSYVRDVFLKDFFGVGTVVPLGDFFPPCK